MLTATLVSTPTPTVSQPARAGQARQLWRLAYRQARAMIRHPRTTTAPTAWARSLDAARKRSGASGWRIAQAAGRLAFDRRTACHAASGSVADLERQGLVRRTARPRRGNLTGMVA